jgi:hypothetical protein
VLRKPLGEMAGLKRVQRRHRVNFRFWPDMAIQITSGLSQQKMPL